MALTFFANFGQTFFISLFGHNIRSEFALSHGEFGAVYSLATLASALFLLWLGSKIDDVGLKFYSSMVCIGLIAACFLLALADSVILLFLSIFALRLSGQGLMGHIAATSMARYFDDQRGTAVSIASFGYSLGEGVLPSLAVFAAGILGWRGTWMAIGGLLVIVLVPLVLWLLEAHDVRHERHIRNTASPKDGASTTRKHWSRKEVLRDPRFYLVLPAVIAPPFILTGMFFHQVHLAESKGWSLAWIATCFVGYAVANVGSSLVSGPLVDRFKAVRLLPFYLMPLGFGILGIAVMDNPGVALFYMIMAGITTGASHIIVGSMWAEIYGVRHLGSIRSVSTSIMVLSTSLAPVAMGWVIDYGVSMEAISLTFLGYIVLSIGLVMIVGISDGKLRFSG